MPKPQIRQGPLEANMHGMENLVFGQIGEARLGESPRGYNNVELEWEGLKDKISMEL